MKNSIALMEPSVCMDLRYLLMVILVVTCTSYSLSSGQLLRVAVEHSANSRCVTQHSCLYAVPPVPRSSLCQQSALHAVSSGSTFIQIRHHTGYDREQCHLSV